MSTENVAVTTRIVPPGMRVGVTEEMIHDVVHSFYADDSHRSGTRPYFQARHRRRLGTASRQDVRFLVVRAVDDRPLRGQSDNEARRCRRHPADAFRALAASLPPDGREAMSAAGRRDVRHALRDDRAQPAAGHRHADAATNRRQRLLTAMAIPKLPDDAVRYRQTPVFTETTIPAGLLGDHRTKEGVWGLIHVYEGKLAYRVKDSRSAADGISAHVEDHSGGHRADDHA